MAKRTKLSEWIGVERVGKSQWNFKSLTMQ